MLFFPSVCPGQEGVDSEFGQLNQQSPAWSLGQVRFWNVLESQPETRDLNKHPNRIHLCTCRAAFNLKFLAVLIPHREGIMFMHKRTPKLLLISRYSPWRFELSPLLRTMVGELLPLGVRSAFVNLHRECSSIIHFVNHASAACWSRWLYW
jgi:hypothetical protein